MTTRILFLACMAAASLACTPLNADQVEDGGEGYPDAASGSPATPTGGDTSDVGAPDAGPLDARGDGGRPEPDSSLGPVDATTGVDAGGATDAGRDSGSVPLDATSADVAFGDVTDVPDVFPSGADARPPVDASDAGAGTNEPALPVGPTVASGAQGDLDIMVRDTSGSIHWRPLRATEADWEPWRTLEPSHCCSAPVPTYLGSTVYMFVDGDGVFAYRRGVGINVWSDWIEQPKDRTTRGTGMTTIEDGDTMAVFIAQGDSIAIYSQRSSATPDEWTSPIVVPGDVTGTPSVVRVAAQGLDAGLSGDLMLFVRWADATLRVSTRVGGIWQPWQNLGESLASSPSAIVLEGSGTTVFAASQERRVVYRELLVGGTTWGDWTSLETTSLDLLASAPSAVQWATPVQTMLFANIQGSSAPVSQMTRKNGGTWEGFWSNLDSF
jgi:hypothetical protein